MRRALELSLTLVVIGVLGFFGVGALEKSILAARKKVLITHLYSISRHLEAFYAEKNRLPDVASLIKIMGWSVCQNNQMPAKSCIELSRVVVGNRRKFWSITNQEGVIFYNTKTGEASAAIKSKTGLQNVAKTTFSKRTGVSILTRAAL